MERKPVAARITPAADALISELATEHQVNRADVFRAMLSVASRHRDEIAAKLNDMKESFV